MEIHYAYSKDLVPSPFNPNVVDPINLDKLRESLKRLGNFRPVIVRDVGNQQQVIAGWHRTLIAQEDDAMGPIINVGVIDDQKAKEICLADNARYGSNNADLFSDLLSSMEVSLDELSEFLPGHFDEATFDNTDVDLDSLDVEVDRKPKDSTHTTLKFRVPIVDANVITEKVNQVVDERGLSENNSSTEAAGEALLWIFLNQLESLE